MDAMRKLLIIGAGGHGKVVAEIAESLGYREIAFLDDNHPAAIGKIEEMETFIRQYSDAFVGIGNNRLRGELLQRLSECGYRIPTLIHPTAYVSRSASIGAGTLVEPMAIVNANSCIGDGCIISVGAIVDHDASIGQCCHINAGAVISAGSAVEELQKIDAGEVVKGSTGLPAADSNDAFAKEYREQTGQEVSFF